MQAHRIRGDADVDRGRVRGKADRVNADLGAPACARNVDGGV